MRQLSREAEQTERGRDHTSNGQPVDAAIHRRDACEVRRERRARRMKGHRNEGSQRAANEGQACGSVSLHCSPGLGTARFEAPSVHALPTADTGYGTNSAVLFGIVSQSPRKPLDPRTARTYVALSSAMVDLLRTHEFDAITVQDLLDRAGVGRATFYTHFRNKDDFLLSDLERMLTALETHFELSARGTKRLAPVAELFEHFGHAREFADALRRSGRIEAVYDITSGHLARMIERRLTNLGVEPQELPLAAAARVFGAMAMELARWWVGRETSLSARDMDAQFHELVWRGLGRRT